MKILISGGHLTPALAFIDYLNQEQPADKVVFIGRPESQPGQKSQERSEVTARRIKFYALNPPRIRSRNKLLTLLSLPGLVTAVFKVVRIINREKPAVFLSFGSYLAVPAALAAWLKQVPVITHEQTLFMGLSSRLIAKLAKKVAVSSAATQGPLPAGKKVVTGNPIRLSLLDKTSPRPAWLPPESKRPLLFITGGNQGSMVINQVICQSLAQLCQDWLVVHQVGNPRPDGDDKRRLEAKAKELPLPLRKRYYVSHWLTERELAWVMQHASLVVARAGANTIAELKLLRLPAVLIPLPHSRFGEQLINAKSLVRLGGALVLNQNNLTPDALLRSVAQVRAQLVEMKASYPLIGRDEVTAVHRRLYSLVKQAAG